MQCPPAMLIELAVDTFLKPGTQTMPDWLKKDQRQELQSFGAVRARGLGSPPTGQSRQLG